MTATAPLNSPDVNVRGRIRGRWAVQSGKGMDAADELLPPLVLDVVTLDREAGRLTGPMGQIDLQWSLRRLLETLMRRPGTFVPEGKLLAVVWGDDVPADGAARLKEALKNASAAARLLSRERVRVRRELPAGYVLEMRPAATKEGRAMLAARAERPRGRPRRG